MHLPQPSNSLIFRKTFFYAAASLLAILTLIFLWFLPGLITSKQDQPVLIIDGEAYFGSDFLLIQNTPYLSVEAVKEKIDQNIHWDALEQQLIITTAEQVIRMKTENLTVTVNNQPQNLEFPVLFVDATPFVQLEPLHKIYNFQYQFYPETKRVILLSTANPRPKGTVTSHTILRTGPSLRSPRLNGIEAGSEVLIFEETKGWYKVLSPDGTLGYLKENKIIVQGIESIPGSALTSAKQPPLQGKINLTWEMVATTAPDMTKIAPPKGVNVVSPTWFYLKDEQGTVGNKADQAYVKWAKRNNYQIWALFANDFNPDKTRAVLQSAALREKVITQLLVYAELYNLDGINLDFENVYMEDKALLVQFVRELAPLLHEQGLTISIDVTVKSNSANWSLCYDRKALVEIVDYVMLMAYDEHWSTSPKAGSVASLPWVEKGIMGLLEEVPGEKLILGIPFYTRLWEESVDSTGKMTVTSRIFDMYTAKNWVKQKGLQVQVDPAAQQHYAQLRQGTSTYKLWLEDEYSLQKRLDLVKKYQLAGVASWRRGFEEPEAWKIIASTLNQP